MAMAQHTLLVQAKPVKTSSSCRDDAPPLPVISTTSGDFLPYYDYTTTSTANGTSSTTTFPDVASFLDIPYAENPTGPLRFSAPVARGRNPASSNDSSSTPAPVQSTKLPGGCFQLYPSNFVGTVMDEAERGFDLAYGDYSGTTEDCLRLSVFAPKTAVEDAAAAASITHDEETTAEGGLPVLIFVHGGGYSFGGIDVAYQLSPSWVQRSQQHIVVQIQYRLNLLGVPGAAALVSSSPSSVSTSPNLSLLDQRMAIEWVRDNIALFGGDASRITLWGQSAGAYAVDAYRYAQNWSSDPIVSGVIADSGNAVAMGVNSLQWPGNSSMFSYAASQLGCGGATDGEPLDPEAELECMRAVPADQLKDYIQNRAPADGLSFSTVVDNVTVFADYSDPSLIPGDSAGARLPTLIGTTTEEGGAVVPYDFEGSETATQLPADEAVIADAFRLGVQCTTLEEVRLRSQEEKMTTYQYLYAGNFTDISPRPWLGAYHTAELPLIFGTVGLQGSASSYEEKATRWAQDAWLAFAKDPVSGLKDEFGWAPAAGVNGSTVMVWAEGDEQIGRSTSVGDLRQECVGNGYAV